MRGVEKEPPVQDTYTHIHIYIHKQRTVRQRIGVLAVTRGGDLNPPEAALRRDDLDHVAHGALHAHGHGPRADGGGAGDDAGDLMYVWDVGVCETGRGTAVQVCMWDGGFDSSTYAHTCQFIYTHPSIHLYVP